MEEKGEYVAQGQVADPWAEKLKARRAALVEEHGRALEQFRTLQQRLAETQALLERLNGAVAVIDEMLKPEWE